MSFGLISRALVGATTAGLLVVSGAGSAFADGGGGGNQASPLYDTHTVAPGPPGTPPVVLTALTGTRVTLHADEDGAFLRAHASGLSGTTTTGAVFIYLNPTLCSGHFATPSIGSKCGGPDPAMFQAIFSGTAAKKGPCYGLQADACRTAVCTHFMFDSCNAANFRVINLTEKVNKHGDANFSVALGNLPAGAEVQFYLAGFTVGGKPAKGTATFHVPGSPDQGGDTQSGDHNRQNQD